MKKIIISASITPSDDSVTVEGLKDMLRKLGSACFPYCAEVELADMVEVKLPKAVWIYASNDDAAHYQMVSGPNDLAGEAISDEDIEQMRSEGICTEFVSVHPRTDRYGAPAYSTDPIFAEGVVGFHGFRVPNEDALEVSTTDRGDDGGEEIWLKIVLPA
jgi:hypothetical protein